MGAAAEEADWAGLPVEILVMIMLKLDDNMSDYIRFFSVCQRWRSTEEELEVDSITKHKLHMLKACRNKLPVLILLSTTQREERVRDLFCPGDGYLYHLKLPSFLCRPCSSLGWLIITPRHSETISLLNPFTTPRKEILLPEFNDCYAGFEDWLDEEDWKKDNFSFIKKGILSSDPSSGGPYELVVIHGQLRRLACFKSRRPIGWIHTGLPYGFYDAIYLNDRVYALCLTTLGEVWNSALFEVDFDSCNFRLVTRTSKVGRIADEAYLVISKDGLLMVHQFRNDFEVFLLRNGMWCKIKNLGNQALFLGINHSVCVSTLEFPMVYRNCIYLGSDTFTIRVFNLEYGTIQSPYVHDEGHYFPPIWVVPNLN